MKTSSFVLRSGVIYSRTKVNGKLVEKSTGITVDDPKCWKRGRYYDPRRLKYSNEINEKLKSFKPELPMLTIVNTLGEALDYHIKQELKLNRIKQSTANTYTARKVAIQGACMEYMGEDDIDLVNVDTNFAVEFRAYLDDNYSPNVVSNTLLLIRSALDTYLLDFRGRSYLDFNVFENKKITSVRNKETNKLHYLDTSLESKLIGLLHSRLLNQEKKDLVLVALLMWNTGLSFVDTCSEVSYTLDLSKERIFTYKRQKSGQEARIPIGNNLKKILSFISCEHYEDQGWDNWLPIQMFIKDGELNQKEYRTQYRRFSYLCTYLTNYLGVSVTPHVFRHSFAVKALEKGYSMEVLKEMMGHASIETTQKYYAYITNRRISSERLNVESA